VTDWGGEYGLRVLNTSKGKSCHYQVRSLSGHTVMVVCTHLKTAVSGSEKQAVKLLRRKHERDQD
jgi:hypothetical protein